MSEQRHDTTLIEHGRVVTPSGEMAPATVVIQDGRIAGIATQMADQPGARRIDATGHLVLPGFIDMHIHGGNGFDVMDATVAAVQGLAAHLAAHGVTGFLATTVTASQADVLAASRAVRQARELPARGARILGMHIEGPYINPLRPGAQNHELIRMPSLSEMGEIIAASGDCVRLVTLAPEVPGAVELIAFLRQHGIIVSAGHSDADYDQALAAFDAGVTHVTHIFNAMRSFHHRQPALVGAALTDRRATVELIADGLHVHPNTVRLVVSACGAGGVVLITDAVSGAGLPYGCYRMSGQDIWTSEHGARLADGTLAGSLLTLEVALRNVTAWTGLPLHQALAMASLNQARELGMDGHSGSLEVGKDADLAICRADLSVLHTLVGGRVVYSAAT